MYELKEELRKRVAVVKVWRGTKTKIAVGEVKGTGRECWEASRGGLYLQTAREPHGI